MKCAELKWLEKHSIPLTRLDVDVLEPALIAATTRLDGVTNAANVSLRRRNMVKSILSVAVRRGLLNSNPMDRVEWKTPKCSVEVDISVLPSLKDINELVEQVSSLRSSGARYAVFFATLGFAGLRPLEAAGIRVVDTELPDSGWGLTHLRGATTSPGARYTKNSETREEKGLKHRPNDATRPVPLPPHLVELLKEHLVRWPSENGLVFSNAAGRSVTTDNYAKVWKRERDKLWTNTNALAQTTPYDLRHTAATTMIRAGVPLPEVARRLGHSIDILLRVYAGVFEDERNRSNNAIEQEFNDLT